MNNAHAVLSTGVPGARGNMWIWMAVLLPLVPVLFGVVRAEWRLRAGTTWFFDVQGYDPRDLLRGRYLQFSTDLHVTERGCSGAPSCCYCLTRVGDRIPPRRAEMDCPRARSACDGFAARKEIDRVQRFYVSEARVQDAERLLRQHAARSTARVEVVIDDDGMPQIVDLWLGERSLNDALNEAR